MERGILGARLVGRGLVVLVSSFVLAGPMAASAGVNVHVSGVVTNSLTDTPVQGVTVTLAPPVAGPFLTGADGSYAADLPAGAYTATFSEDSYTSQDQAINVVGSPVVLDVSLVPRAPVLVSASLSGTPEPGAALQAVGTIEILDGSSLTSVAWTQAPFGAPAALTNADQPTADVTLASETEYKDELIRILAEPPVDPSSNLPPGVEIPPGEFHGGLQDRYQVVAVNPLMVEDAGKIVLLLTVVTSSGTYTAPLEIDVALPWKVASGLRNVPIGRPVLVHAKDRPAGDTDPYDWTLVRPASSSADLVDPATQDAWFTPDVEGKYTLRVTDPATTDVIAIDVYAGTWVGAITGIDSGDGLPLAADCTSFCHNTLTNIAPDNFTPWRESGHAEIFTQNLNTNSHYSTDCFQCHSVGYDPEVANGGFDDAPDYQPFLAAGLLGTVSANNWTTVVDNFPDTARRANVQCENCHGPRSQLAAHGNSAVSVSLAATNCAQCHGEPLRHGRYQQWQLSGHADYSVALDENKGTNGSCARCHSANGFLTWLPILLDDDPTTDPLANITVTWGIDDVHPQTCVTCHDPHDPGNVSGEPTNATVRIVGDTPPLIAGFQATNVGKAAICMTCHNTRRGLRNDDTFPTLSGSELSRAPHPGAQADTVMGQNAFLVTVGNRGPHSNRDLSGKVADVCVDCHMEATPPPADLSYNQSGTNHTFWARRTICGTCHTDGRTADDVQLPVDGKLAQLKTDLEGAILDAFGAETDQGNTIDLNGLATVTSPAQVSSLEFTEGSGQQAITVSLGGGAPIGPVALGNVRVKDGGGNTLGRLYERTDPALPKAGWNFLLLESDGSHGLHNPEFANTVLDASITAVEAVPEAGGTAAALVAMAALAGLGRRARRSH